MTKDIIFCQKCNIFRPLDMFKNLLHDPFNVTEQELIFLDQRRKMEKQMILDKDILSQEMEDDADKEAVKPKLQQLAVAYKDATGDDGAPQLKF